MNIQIIRGDTAKYKFQRIDSEGVITTRPRHLYFTVKETANKKAVVFQKTIDDMTLDEDGTWHFTIEPEDTNGKQYGDYVFDIEVINMNAIKSTVAYGVFKIKPEVTWVENEVS
jgi:hypothetical protein